VNDETPDEALAVRAATGDAEAFRALYDRHRNMIYTLALRMTGSDADAEDVLQQTFLRAYRALPRFRGDSKFTTWLWRVAVSAALTERKSKSRAASPVDDAAFEGRAAAGPSPDDAAEATDEASMLRGHLEALPRRDRALLHMRYQEGKSFEEISDLMEMPVGTLKSLVFRAKAELRRNMERDGHAV
jgi:RNA polymerase sigma-70 factor (ECF subfamily)